MEIKEILKDQITIKLPGNIMDAVEEQCKITKSKNGLMANEMIVNNTIKALLTRGIRGMKEDALK